jgi:hypothetical protein
LADSTVIAKDNVLVQKAMGNTEFQKRCGEFYRAATYFQRFNASTLEHLPGTGMKMAIRPGV